MAKKKMKRGRVTFPSGLPFKISDDSPKSVWKPLRKQELIMDRVVDTIAAYLKSAKELLNDKYSVLRDFAPAHLSNPGNVLIACCDDGVAIRYEEKHEDHKLIIAWYEGSLSQLLPAMSESVVYCHDKADYTSTIPETGPEIKLSKFEASTGKSIELFKLKVGFDAIIQKPIESLPAPPRKPYCLLSVRNRFELEMLGETIPDEKDMAGPKRFRTRTPIRLPVGWECIEVFPFFNLDQWKQEYSEVWAEKDLLASVTARQLHEFKFSNLDPYAVARREFSNLLGAYKKLLDSEPEREEILQAFLKENPLLLCPTGVKVWPKLTLGARDTDFVFREATGHYLLVELEKSTHRLFRQDGHPNRYLNQALGQLTDWRRYIEDNLPTVQRELGLTDISTNPEGLIVIGRTQYLTSKNRRKLVTIQNEMPRTKIMTYDDVFENARAVAENLLGPLSMDVGNTMIYYLT